LLHWPATVILGAAGGGGGEERLSGEKRFVYPITFSLSF
jgi:hypothetical protein